MINKDEVFTLAEVAKKMKVTENTVRKWCRDGVIPAYKIGRHWRINGDDFRKHINWLKRKGKFHEKWRKKKS